MPASDRIAGNRNRQVIHQLDIIPTLVVFNSYWRRRLRNTKDWYTSSTWFYLFGCYIVVECLCGFWAKTGKVASDCWQKHWWTRSTWYWIPLANEPTNQPINESANRVRWIAAKHKNTTVLLFSHSCVNLIAGPSNRHLELYLEFPVTLLVRNTYPVRLLVPNIYIYIYISIRLFCQSAPYIYPVTRQAKPSKVLNEGGDDQSAKRYHSVW
jgi:hypothetical protein